MSDIYWTFEYEGELQDVECETKDKLETYLDGWFASKFEDAVMRNGEIHEEECWLVQMGFDVFGGPEEISREPHTLHYEHYHGDLAEHGTWGR